MKICIYHGPSAYTGEPIRAYLYDSRGNGKTGAVAGLVIVAEGATDIVAAARDGSQRAGCGNCRYLLGDCYALNGRTPWGLLGLLRSGASLPASTDVGADVRAFLRIAHPRALRSAVFGDAAALPVDVWAQVETAARAAGVPVLGYTHGHLVLGLDGVDHLRASHVLSVDPSTDPAVLAAAHARGWRHFRVGVTGERPAAGEFACPAGAERDHVATCGDCLACGTVGNTGGRRSVLIWDHSPRAAAATRRHLRALSISGAARGAL